MRCSDSKPELPARTAQMSIPKPLVPALSELSKDQLEVFQVILNGATTQGVLDKSRQADCDAAQVLVESNQKRVRDRSRVAPPPSSFPARATASNTQIF